MVGHEHMGLAGDARRLAILPQEAEVEPEVIIGKEGAGPPVAALSDVVGKAGNNDTGETGHGGMLGQGASRVN